MEVLLYAEGLNIRWHKEQIVKFKIKADHSPLGPTFTRMEERKDAHSGRFCCNFTVRHLKLWSSKSQSRSLSFRTLNEREASITVWFSSTCSTTLTTLSIWLEYLGWWVPLLGLMWSFQTAVERCVHVHFHVYVWKNWLGLQTLQKTVEPFQIRMHDMVFPHIDFVTCSFLQIFVLRTSRPMILHKQRCRWACCRTNTSWDS